MSNSLAELENKLRELESKLNSLGAEPQKEPTAPASARPEAIPEPAGFQAPAVDPIAERAHLVDEASAPPLPPFAEPSPHGADQGRLVDEALASDTQASAGRSSSPPVLAELLGFRERLERLTRELLEDYNRLLARVADQPSQPQPVAAEAGFQTTPTAALDMPPATYELTQFEGHVELGVGPFFNDMQWLIDFQSHLTRIPNITKTSIRRVEAGHAVLDLELAAPVTLLAELRTAVDGDFSVREVSQNRLAITLEDS